MTVRIVSALAAATLLTVPCQAQIRASEAASVSQTVDGTEITVTYSRPQLRGRAPGPDGVIHIEHMWTPGANWATVLEVSRPITLNGHPVPAGSYSLWTETGGKEWTFHLHPDARLFHTAAPRTRAMRLTFKVAPQLAAEPVEALTFDFPAVRQDGATLRFRWARVVIPFEIGVEPSRQLVAMTREQAAPYLGGYTVHFFNELNQRSPDLRMEILLADGALRGVIDGPEPFIMQFLPEPAPHTFLLAFMLNDKVFDVEVNTPITFEVQGGRAARWSAKGLEGVADGAPWIQGTRRP